MTQVIRWRGNHGIGAVVFRRSLKNGKTAVLIHEKDKLGTGWDIEKTAHVDIVGRNNNLLYSYNIPKEQIADWFPGPFVLD